MYNQFRNIIDMIENQKTSEFKITSPAFENGEQIPIRHTCDDKNTNPPLIIDGVPDGTKSLVLIMEDLNSPAGKWCHWITFNLPPTTTEIPEGYEPGGISGKGSSGNLDYFGPCPPDGEHTYVITVYALNEMLDLPEGASKEEITKAMSEKIIAEALLSGRYVRNNA